MIKLNIGKKGKELRKVVVDTLMELMKENDKIVALEGDLGEASGFNRFIKDNSNNFIQCGISEANMIGVSAGLSYLGYIPFVHTFSPFATRRVFDQLYLSGYSKANINIYGSDPGFTAAINGGTHTSYEDIALVSCIPDSIVCDASDEVLLNFIIKSFSKLKSGIHYVRANRKAVDNIYDEDNHFELGKGILTKNGKDVLVISCGQVVSEALKAAFELEKENISVGVIDMFTVKPLDEEIILNNLNGKKAVVVFENHNYYGGLGSMVAMCLANHQIALPFKIHAIYERFGQVGSADFLQDEYKLTAKYLIETIKSLL